MRPLVHRLIAALLVLAFVVPAAAPCASASSRPDPMAGPMAGMSCCKKLAPSTSGSMQRDCCRMNGQLPEPVPAAPVPPRTIAQADIAPALIALPVAPVTADIRTRHEIQSTRERPLAPAFLRTAILLI
jgi:hypothetical protein